MLIAGAAIACLPRVLDLLEPTETLAIRDTVNYGILCSTGNCYRNFARQKLMIAGNGNRKTSASKMKVLLP